MISYAQERSLELDEYFYEDVAYSFHDKFYHSMNYHELDYICELSFCDSKQYFDTSSSICSNIFECDLIYNFYLNKTLIEKRKKSKEPCSDIAFECDNSLVCIGTNGSKKCS